jgi:outer membrane protein TolC
MNLNWITRASVVTIGALFLSMTAAAQAERPESVQLTLADAVQLAIEHNPNLAIVRLDTEVEAARVGESRGAFVPVFSTELGRSRDVTPPTSALVSDSGLEVKDWFSSTGVRQRAPGRRHLERLWDTARTTTNSPFTTSTRTCSRAFSWPSAALLRTARSTRRASIHRREAQSRQLELRFEAVVQTAAASNRPTGR